MPQFQRVKNDRLYLKIVDQFRTMVEDGQLGPGDRLPSEREVAEQVGVSRAAVREAFSAMVTMGLIEVKPGDGTFVKTGDLVTSLAAMVPVEDDATQAREMMELRRSLEAETAFLAAQRALPVDLSVIRRILQRMEQDVHADGLGEAADWDFHMAVAIASRNTLMVRVMQHLQENLRRSVVRSRQVLYQLPGMPLQLLGEHTAICEAISARRPDDAQRLMTEHIDNAMRHMAKHITPNPTPPKPTERRHTDAQT